jgi:hypothetical protein
MIVEDVAELPSGEIRGGIKRCVQVLQTGSESGRSNISDCANPTYRLRSDTGSLQWSSISSALLGGHPSHSANWTLSRATVGQESSAINVSRRRPSGPHDRLRSPTRRLLGPELSQSGTNPCKSLRSRCLQPPPPEFVAPCALARADEDFTKVPESVIAFSGN